VKENAWAIAGSILTGSTLLINYLGIGGL
jgi:hypothetical protein